MANITATLFLMIFLLLDNSSVNGLSPTLDSENNKDYIIHNTQKFQKPLQFDLKVPTRQDLRQQHGKNQAYKDQFNSVVKRHMDRQTSHLQQHRHHYQRSHDLIKYPPINHLHNFPAWSNFNGDSHNGVKDSFSSNKKDQTVLSEATADDGFMNHSDVGENYEGSNDDIVEELPQNIRCPKCQNHGSRVEHVSKEQLTQLRIEFVKNQILEKLRLKERPNVSAKGLPKPIYEDATIQHGEDEMKRKSFDDYYARTSKKFIFLEREIEECDRIGINPSICFSFKIDYVDPGEFDVSTAVLWIFSYKQIKSYSSINQDQDTIIISEVEQDNYPKYLPKIKPIAIQSINVQGEWMQINIEWPIKRWFGNHDLNHLIHITCQACEMGSMDSMISIDPDYQPFIMVDTQNRHRLSRQKRSVNCTDGITECCREKLYISFDDIGWGDWIIQPRGYDAYFCRGKCGTLASITQITSPHSSLLQKVLSTNKFGTKSLEWIPCCTAKQYSSLQLVFMDSNNTATLKTFPNMVVESCGCR